MRYFIYFFCFVSFAQANAQNALKISGKVIDSLSSQPVEYATITVIDKASQHVVNGAVSDGKGLFEVAGLPAGSYRLAVEFIGYSKKMIEVTPGGKNAALGNVLLAPAAHALQSVTITGSAPVIENKIDKLVYNAANDITAQGGMALDILKKVPQVNVDIDGNVELQGNSNIRFLINGKPSSVFGNSITDALAAIPGSQIKSIEVITSPGAKYDAQGTGGIINIILKDNKMQGINGSVNLSGGSRLENGSASLNIRHNNFGINTYVNGNAQVPSRTPATQERTSQDAAGNQQKLMQDGYSDFQRNGYQAGIGMDWNATKHDNITASLSYNHFGNSGSGITNITQDSAYQPLPSSVRNSSSSFHTNSMDWSVNYKKNFAGEGQELNVLYSASYGLPHTAYTQSQTYTGSSIPYSGAESSNPGTNQEHNISVDYAHPVTKTVLIETGVKTVLQSITSEADVNTFRAATDSYTADPGQSYRLNYERQVYAGYLSGSFAIGKLLKIKAGARYEHTDTKIDAGTTVPPYNTLVPSLVFSHDFKTSFVKLSYSRRIERPDYRDINPFVNRADPYNLTTGNPLLLPEIGNNFELGYNKNFGKGTNFYIGLIERINTQDHKQFTRFYTTYEVDDTTFANVSVSTTENTGTEYNTGISASGSWTIKDKLSLRSNVSVFDRYLATSIGSGNIDAGIRVRVNMNVTYQFAGNLVAEAFGNYNSASGNIQGRSPQNISYTVAVRKQFWQKNASIGLTATNLFNEYTRQVTTVNTSNYSSYNVRMVPYRSVGISFTYKFGKLEFKKNKEEENFLNNQPAN